MAITLNDLYASPDHYLHSFDGDAAVFLPMDRAAYHRSIFLDARIAPARDGAMRVAAAALANPAARAAPMSWIFHVAHCGSTLLARALDRPEGNLVLREPLALRQVAVAPNEGRLRIVAALIARRYRPDLPTLVKANVPVNFLLPDLARVDPDARVLFLHLPLGEYVQAILRSDEHRAWLGRVSGQLAGQVGDPRHRSDAERAAALWGAQMRGFAVASAAWPDARSLDAERFFAEPAHVLAAAAALLGVEEPAGGAGRAADGPLFATYSKNPSVAFSNDSRLNRRRAQAAALAGEVAEADRWIDRHDRAARDAAAALEAIRLA